MSALKKILLTGGTGRLGKKLLQFLSTGDFHIDILTRNPVDTTTSYIHYLKADITVPESLHAFHHDYDAVIHCASNPLDADAVDNKGTDNLLRAIKDTSIGNFIYISITGVDKTTFPYYVNKRKAEQLIIQSRIPYTILRFTQFHDFVYKRILNAASSHTFLSFPAGLYFQSMDLSDVCMHIKKSIDAPPSNTIQDIGGPEINSIEEMAEAYRQLKSPSMELKPFTALNDFQKLFTTGINLCPREKAGTITWKDYISAIITIPETG